MINTFEVFSDNLVKNELSQSRKHGIKVAIPIRSVFPNENGKADSSLELSNSLQNFYSYIDSILISWSLPRENPDTFSQFIEDAWIKENYTNKGYESGLIHEMLGGFINIQKLEDMLNPEYCKEQGYFYKLKSTDGVNPDDYLPFDICAGMTACLKVENGKILDNVWLVITEDVDECLYDMQVTIEEYLDLAYQAKIFRHWQAIFLWTNEYDRFELMKRFLPIIVPHVKLDLSAFGIN